MATRNKKYPCGELRSLAAITKILLRQIIVNGWRQLKIIVQVKYVPLNDERIGSIDSLLVDLLNSTESLQSLSAERERV
jgi:hypothetical protein